MKKVSIDSLLKQTPEESEVVLYGWVKSRRRHPHLVFLDIVDSTGSIQAVVEETGNQEAFHEARLVTPESAVKVTGILKGTGRSHPAKEVLVNTITIIGAATLNISPHPRSNIDIFDPRLQEQLLEKRHFYLRNEKIAAILKFRHLLMRLVHRWFDEKDFIEIHAPVLTPTPLYEDRTAMPIQIHGQDVFLTQCVGFYLEQAVHSFERIYNIGPSFRAEESRSKRHLMEYWHIKAEMAFVDFEDLAKMVESFIRDITEGCLLTAEPLAQTIETQICRDGLKVPFPRIDYEDAIILLQKHGADIEFGRSLGSEEESMLSEQFGETPFWVVSIPRSIEPFPYVINSDDPRRTRTADLIASRGFGELLGIAEKIQSGSMLDERLREKGKEGDPRYNWLRDLRQYGCVPHGGFGMGLERLIRWLLQIPHVRDTIPFHRVFGRKIDP